MDLKTAQLLHQQLSISFKQILVNYIDDPINKGAWKDLARQYLRELTQKKSLADILQHAKGLCERANHGSTMHWLSWGYMGGSRLAARIDLEIIKKISIPEVLSSEFLNIPLDEIRLSPRSIARLQVDDPETAAEEGITDELEIQEVVSTPCSPSASEATVTKEGEIEQMRRKPLVKLYDTVNCKTGFSATTKDIFPLIPQRVQMVINTSRELVSRIQQSTSLLKDILEKLNKKVPMYYKLGKFPTILLSFVNDEASAVLSADISQIDVFKRIARQAINDWEDYHALYIKGTIEPRFIINFARKIKLIIDDGIKALREKTDLDEDELSELSSTNNDFASFIELNAFPVEEHNSTRSNASKHVHF